LILCKTYVYLDKDIEAILPSGTRTSLQRNPIMIYVVFIIFDNHVYYQIPISELMELYKVIKNPIGLADMVCDVRGGPFV
jgi:hypothetical protein